jgi:hypothetical protein
MFRSKKILLTVNLASLLLCYSSVGHAYDAQTSSTLFNDSQKNANKSSFYIGLLYIPVTPQDANRGECKI